MDVFWTQLARRGEDVRMTSVNGWMRMVATLGIRLSDETAVGELSEDATDDEGENSLPPKHL